MTTFADIPVGTYFQVDYSTYLKVYDKIRKYHALYIDRYNAQVTVYLNIPEDTTVLAKIDNEDYSTLPHRLYQNEFTSLTVGDIEFGESCIYDDDLCFKVKDTRSWTGIGLLSDKGCLHADIAPETVVKRRDREKEIEIYKSVGIDI